MLDEVHLAWLAGQKDLVALLLVALALLVYARDRHLWLVPLLLLAAMFGKSVAVAAPLLLIALQRYAAAARRRQLATLAAPQYLKDLTRSHSPARRALKKAGYRAREGKAMEMRLQDKPGSLGRTAGRFGKSRVNISSMYVLAPGRGNVGVAFGVKDARGAKKALGR